MLYEFSVSNYGPFRNKATLSLQITSCKEHPENVITPTSLKEKALSSCLIFGSNAAGKSYILKGIKALQDLLYDINFKRTKLTDYEPFRLSEETLSQPTEFEICVGTEGCIYEYSVGFTKDSITHEHLSRIGRKKHPIFERNNGIITVYDCIDVTSMATQNTPYLTLASKHNDKVCNQVLDAVLEIEYLEGDRVGRNIADSFDYIESNPLAKEMALDALNAADFNISAIREDKKPPYGPSGKNEDDFFSIHPDLLKLFNKTFAGNLYITHDYEVPPNLTEFPIDIESNGTKNMLGIIGPLASALIEGHPLVIDEFGSCMHPVLTRWIIDLFSGRYNVNGAQLIVSTHDLSLMDIQNLVRRDQIYFVNKDHRTGESELYSLSDFNGVRKDTKVMDAYLFGRFDAVPNMISPRRKIR